MTKRVSRTSYIWSVASCDLQPKYHIPSDLEKSIIYYLSLTWREENVALSMQARKQHEMHAIQLIHAQS